MARVTGAQKPESYPDTIHEIVLQHHSKTVLGPMKEWKQNRRLPPVLLLTGQKGIGKRSLARFLVKWTLCETAGFADHSAPHENSDSDWNLPCEKCPACQKIDAGNQVNLIEIVSDLEGESARHSGALKIDQFRELKATVGMGVPDGKYKFVLIPNAERMTVQASNSILKLLEETPRGWIFILTSHDPTLLISTLVSRCQILRLKPLEPQDIQELLKRSDIDPERHTICASLSQGSWDRALHFARDDVWKQRKSIFQFLKSPMESIHLLMDWASQEPENFEILLDLLEQLTAELIRWTTLDPPIPPEHYPWLQSDGASEISFHAKKLVRQTGGVHSARLFWLDRAERLAQVRTESLAPLNRKLLAQDLLFPWIGATSS